MTKSSKIAVTIVVAVTPFVLLSILRRLFIGYDIDEQYAATIAYRLVKGDILVKELWEPHQMSAIILAPFIWFFVTINSGTQFLMLYLRVLGLLAQIGICILWDSYFKKFVGLESLICSNVVILAVQPKLIQIPEFANMQIWTLLLTIICLLKAKDTGRHVYEVFAGIGFTLQLLDYPLSIILLPLILFFFAKHAGNKKRICFTSILLFVAPIILLALCILSYVCINMSYQEFVIGVRNIVSDGSHKASFAVKWIGYIKELLGLLLYLLVYMLVGMTIAFLCKKLLKEEMVGESIFDLAAYMTLAVAAIDQLKHWVIDKGPNLYPGYWYVASAIVGGIVYIRGGEKFKKKWGVSFGVVSITSIASVIFVAISSNLELKADFVHLLPMVILTILMVGDRDNNVIFRKIGIWSLVILSLFGSIYLVRINNEGQHKDVTLVRQKINYGPAKMIYAEYMDGYSENERYTFVCSVIPQGEKVFYVGCESDTYMFDDYEVCSPSIISTPTFGSNVMEYFLVNTNKQPQWAIVSDSYYHSAWCTEEFREWFQCYFDMDNVFTSDNLKIYKARDNGGDV